MTSPSPAPAGRPTDETGEATCPFCDYEGPSRVVREWADTFAIEPINPVTPGHLLVIPREHRETAGESPYVTADTFRCAAELAAEIGDCNLIQSNGEAATQTIRHLHVHVIPRAAGDGLALPWSPALSVLAARAHDAEDRVAELGAALEQAERDFNHVSTRMTMAAVNNVGNMIDHATQRISKARGYPLPVLAGRVGAEQDSDGG